MEIKDNSTAISLSGVAAVDRTKIRNLPPSYYQLSNSDLQRKHLAWALKIDVDDNVKAVLIEMAKSADSGARCYKPISLILKNFRLSDFEIAKCLRQLVKKNIIYRCPIDNNLFHLRVNFEPQILNKAGG